MRFVFLIKKIIKYYEAINRVLRNKFPQDLTVCIVASFLSRAQVGR